MTDRQPRRKYIPFPALLTAEQHTFIAERAQYERTSKNDIVRRAVDYYRFFVSNNSIDRTDHSNASNK